MSMSVSDVCDWLMEIAAKRPENTLAIDEGGLCLVEVETGNYLEVGGSSALEGIEDKSPETRAYDAHIWLEKFRQRLAELRPQIGSHAHNAIWRGALWYADNPVKRVDLQTTFQIVPGIWPDFDEWARWIIADYEKGGAGLIALRGIGRRHALAFASAYRTSQA